jgi:hypothetical protein
MPPMISGSTEWPSSELDQETARQELVRLVDRVWEAAAGSPEQHFPLQLAASDLAIKVFTSGMIAARPSIETLEQVVAATLERVGGLPDETRGIAEAVMALLEDPKHERVMLNSARTRGNYGYRGADHPAQQP